MPLFALYLTTTTVFPPAGTKNLLIATGYSEVSWQTSADMEERRPHYAHLSLLICLRAHFKILLFTFKVLSGQKDPPSWAKSSSGDSCPLASAQSSFALKDVSGLEMTFFSFLIEPQLSQICLHYASHKATPRSTSRSQPRTSNRSIHLSPSLLHASITFAFTTTSGHGGAHTTAGGNI